LKLSNVCPTTIKTTARYCPNPQAPASSANCEFAKTINSLKTVDEISHIITAVRLVRHNILGRFVGGGNAPAIIAIRGIRMVHNTPIIPSQIVGEGAEHGGHPGGGGLGGLGGGESYIVPNKIPAAISIVKLPISPMTSGQLYSNL
jgi:hypothetical protein